MAAKLRFRFQIEGEPYLTYWAAIDLIRCRLNRPVGMPIGPAQAKLSSWCDSKGVRVRRVNPPEHSVPPNSDTGGLEQFYFSENDLEFLIDQQTPQENEPPAASMVHEAKQSPATARKRSQQNRAKKAIDARWPNEPSPPTDLPDGTLCTEVIKWLKADCKKRDIPFVPIGNSSILRAAGRKK